MKRSIPILVSSILLTVILSLTPLFYLDVLKSAYADKITLSFYITFKTIVLLSLLTLSIIFFVKKTARGMIFSSYFSMFFIQSLPLVILLTGRYNSNIKLKLGFIFLIIFIYLLTAFLIIFTFYFINKKMLKSDENFKAETTNLLKEGNEENGK